MCSRNTERAGVAGMENTKDLEWLELCEHQQHGGTTLEVAVSPTVEGIIDAIVFVFSESYFFLLD